MMLVASIQPGPACIYTGHTLTQTQIHHISPSPMPQYLCVDVRYWQFMLLTCAFVYSTGNIVVYFFALHQLALYLLYN